VRLSNAKQGGIRVKIDLSGRVAVVSGASTGIGRAIAQGLAEAGADVVIGSRNAEAVRRAATEITGSTGRHAMGVLADVSQPEGVGALIGAATHHFGKINILVANAGGPPPGSALSLTDAQWEQAFRQNLMSAVWLIRGAVPSMKAQGGGRIITVITSGVKVPIPNLVLSNVFRSGVVALVKTLSLELAPHKILLNNLAPGRIRTRRTQEIDEAAARASNRTPEDVERESTAAIPAGRYGEPREFANMAVFLASDQASYVTGTTIAIDGGATRAMQ
jgi:3-oxoacyl-[acyl-carrier protein] reductase